MLQKSTLSVAITLQCGGSVIFDVQMTWGCCVEDGVADKSKKSKRCERDAGKLKCMTRKKETHWSFQLQHFTRRESDDERLQSE